MEGTKTEHTIYKALPNTYAMRSFSLSVMLVTSLTAARSTSTSAFVLSSTTLSTTHRPAPPSCSSYSTAHAPPTSIRHSFTGVDAASRRSWPAAPLRMSTAEETPASTVEAPSTQQSVDIPTSLPSESGIDYVPLATMLATGDLKGADQFTRDALIKAAGAGSQKRDFVYWTEVKNIPG